MIRMTQHLYPRKGHFHQASFVAKLIKLCTPIPNPVILIKPGGKTYLDISKVFRRLQ